VSNAVFLCRNFVRARALLIIQALLFIKALLCSSRGYVFQQVSFVCL
jgi:hypothetical protein